MAGVHDHGEGNIITTVLYHALGAGGRDTEGLETEIVTTVLCLALGAGGRDTEANSTAFLSTSVLGEATADNTEWNGFFRPGSS